MSCVALGLKFRQSRKSSEVYQNGNDLSADASTILARLQTQDGKLVHDLDASSLHVVERVFGDTLIESPTRFGIDGHMIALRTHGERELGNTWKADQYALSVKTNAEMAAAFCSCTYRRRS